jgi:hypothetical protein
MKTPTPEAKPILLRHDAEIAKAIDDVHHELRFKSRAEAIRAMLKAGAAVLLKEAGKRKR